MGSKKKATIITMLFSVVNAAFVTIFNLIYNNYLIQVYGSQINGLVSTLTQFVSLFSIIEGGFTTAAIVAVYNPIVQKDYTRLNQVLYTTKKIFLRIGTLITLSVLIGGSIYIKFIDSPLTYSQTYMLLVVSVLTTSLSLCCLSKYTVLLQGDNKEYVLVRFSLLSKTITWVISMVLIIRNANVIVVYAINAVNIVINIILVRRYEKKFYPYADYKGTYDRELIDGTKDILLQKIANTVFTSTDLILISACISLASASAYNLYNQVFRAVFTLLTSVVQAPFNSFGQLVNSEEGRKKMPEYFNIYQHVVVMTATMLLSVAGELVIPFVRIYTQNIFDYNYIYPSLAILFFLQFFSQIINRPYGTILNVTGNFKMQNKQSVLAAIVNIIVSVLFIEYWGLNSIILGSFVGTLIILVMNIYQAYKNILNSSAVRTIFGIGVNYLVGVSCIVTSLKLDIRPGSYMEWCFYAIFFTLITGMLVFVANYITNRTATVKSVKYLLRR